LRKQQILIALIAFSLLLTAAPILFAIEKSLTMEIGDPARKDKKARLVLDAITDTRTGDLLSPAETAARLADKRLVLVGESHTDINFHRAQLRIIEELHKAGRKVLLGLEMFPYTKQEFLTAWSNGEYTEAEFLDAADWYDAWGYHWNYYRDIFVFARDNGIPVYGLNTPREIIAAVRKKGIDELTEEEKSQMPPGVDVDNDEHYALFKSYFDEDEDFHASMTEEQWRGMFAAQCTWDATFANNAKKVLDEHPDPNAVLVVLVGSGHTTYDLGIQRQMAQWAEVPTATVIPIPIVIEEDDGLITEVQASYADYIWGMPPAIDPIYPSLGLSTRSAGGDDEKRTVIFIAEDSVAEQAGFQMGDLLLEVDGEPLSDRASFSEILAGMNWGDRAVVTVERGESEVDLEVVFRREAPDQADSE
jgi:uncharacterized iron-regulated protein